MGGTYMHTGSNIDDTTIHASSCMDAGLEHSGKDSEDVGYIAQWLERLTADQQVPGSTPGVP